MSDVERYEFVAVDRALGASEVAALRAAVPGAEVTPTRLARAYARGTLEADPYALVARYFDAMVCVAGGGGRQWLVALPGDAVEPARVGPYCVGGGLAMRVVAAGRVVLDFHATLEGPADEGDPAAWLRSLLPLREEIRRGDLRALYVAWLAGATAYAEPDDATLEPAVPAGLGARSRALASLAAFLGVSDELLAAAAEGAAAAGTAGGGVAEGAVRAWLAGVPADEKDAWLARAATGRGGEVGAEVRRRYERAAGVRRAAEGGSARRTVGELITTAGALAALRAQKARAKGAERAKRAREARGRGR